MFSFHAKPLILEAIGGFRRHRPSGRFIGLGIALPSPFNVKGITSVGPTALPGWDELDIAPSLEALTGIPVLIENDATCAAMGERLHGLASEVQNFVHLFIGSGLGAGMYLGNRLYAGHWHNAGEIGHMTVIADGKACYCGNNGCLERYISIAAFMEHLGRETGQNLAAEEIDKPDVRMTIDAWLAEAVPALRQAINIIESLLDPQTILISGFLPDAILTRLVDGLKPLSRSISSRADRQFPRVQLGAAGNDAVAVGAAALTILAEITPDYESLLKRPLIIRDGTIPLCEQ